jgi:hypothetical protein
MPVNPALLKHAEQRRKSLENRIADQITRFAGSMTFVYLHIIWFAAWIILGVEHYPYGLLTMIVSLEAIFPLTAGERARLEARLPKLTKIESEASKASQNFTKLRTPKVLRIRPNFVIRDSPATAPGDSSDRLLPDRHERPPATRLVSPRGIALKVYLTALFLAQTRSPGERPRNKLPLADPGQVSWIDLIATPAERGGVKTYSSVRDKKERQLQEALRRLSRPWGAVGRAAQLPEGDRQVRGFPADARERRTLRRWRQHAVHSANREGARPGRVPAVGLGVGGSTGPAGRLAPARPPGHRRVLPAGQRLAEADQDGPLGASADSFLAYALTRTRRIQ